MKALVGTVRQKRRGLQNQNATFCSGALPDLLSEGGVLSRCSVEATDDSRIRGQRDLNW